jgi:hypothetical protein
MTTVKEGRGNVSLQWHVDPDFATLNWPTSIL